MTTLKRRCGIVAAASAAGFLLAGCGSYETTLPHGYTFVPVITSNMTPAAPASTATLSDPISSQPDPMTSQGNPIMSQGDPILNQSNPVITHADPLASNPDPTSYEGDPMVGIGSGVGPGMRNSKIVDDDQSTADQFPANPFRLAYKRPKPHHGLAAASDTALPVDPTAQPSPGGELNQGPTTSDPGDSPSPLAQPTPLQPINAGNPPDAGGTAGGNSDAGGSTAPPAGMPQDGSQ